MIKLCASLMACGLAMGGIAGSTPVINNIKRSGAVPASDTRTMDNKMLVCGIDLTDDGETYGDTGFARYNSENYTLTLDNYSCTVSGTYINSDNFHVGIGYGINHDLEIVVNGENVINLNAGTPYASIFGMLLQPENYYSHDYTVTFSGTGSLEINARENNKDTRLDCIGAKSYMNFVNSTASLKFTSSDTQYGQSTGLHLEKPLTLSGGRIEADGYMTCIDAQDINMTGGEIWTRTHEETYNNVTPTGILAHDGYNYNFTGGKVTLKGMNGFTGAESTVLNISGDVDFTAMGSKRAIEGNVLNSLSGTGYDQMDLWGNHEPIGKTTEPINYSTEEPYNTYKTVQFKSKGPKAAYTVEPTAKTGLVYNGRSQELINAGYSSEGTLVYRLGTTGDFSENIPSAVNAGTYTVQYKINGNNSHEDSDVGTLTITIGEASGDITPSPEPGTDTPTGTDTDTDTGTDTSDTPATPGDTSKKSLGTGAVIGISFGSFVFLLGAAYLVLLFLFNKWILVDDKAVRVIPFALGYKEDMGRYLTFKFTFEYRADEEVYRTKDDALNHK